MGHPWKFFEVHADAIVLGVWEITGCVKVLSFGLPYLPVTLLGMITAVGGGMIRDVAIGQVPSVFSGGKLYATPALMSAVIIVGFHGAGYSFP